MFASSILATSTLLATAYPPFDQWAAEWGANSESEGVQRKYEENCQEMHRLSNAHPGAFFKVNEFSGMTYEEFSKKFLMTTSEPADSDVPHIKSSRSRVDAADAIFWPITGIRSQTCNSCWAFAAMAMIESGAVSRGAPNSLVLAEKEILDCSKYDRCMPGRAEEAFRALAGKDIYTEVSCPWSGEKEDCSSCAAAVPSGITISGYHRAPEKSDAALLQELQHDSVAVYITANQAFVYGWTGIDSNPPTDDCTTNHVVLVMGYDFRGSVPYWQIKNSWGASWGESGTARFKRTTEGCGPYSIFREYLVQADGISTFPVETGWCCSDLGCAYDTCFGDDQHCTQVGPDGCASDCGGTWCARTPALVPTPAPTPAPATTTPAPPAEWCCQDPGCAADTCFPADSFCTLSGPETCVDNCGGTWCLTATTTPAPLAEWCCQDVGCAADTCFDGTMYCTQAGAEACASNCGGTWCTKSATPPAPTPSPSSGWCCQDTGCAVATCFAEDTFCTQSGPDKCATNCGGTWCATPVLV